MAADTAIFRGETLDEAGLVKPGQIDLSGHAPMLAIDAESFLKVPANGDRQVDMSETAVGEIDTHKPAVRIKAFQKSSPHGEDFATQQRVVSTR